MMSIALTFAFTACSDDDNNEVIPAPNPVEKSELAFDVDTLEVGVHETATFTITSGAGDYKIINENPAIASGTVEGNVVTVTSEAKGITGLVVSDAKGGYKRVLIKSMYMRLVTDKEEVAVGMKLGHSDGVASFDVTEGNGSYTAMSADESIAKIRSIDDKTITVQGVAEGSTTITITDMMGLQKTVKVTVETTTIPYTDEEKAKIMEGTVNTAVFDGNTSYSWGTWKANETASPKIVWDYYGYYSLKVDWQGDFTVGKKTGGKVYYKFSWGGQETVLDVDVEVLKNDGSRIWGIMSTIKDGNYLAYGYFSVGL